MADSSPVLKRFRCQRLLSIDPLTKLTAFVGRFEGDDSDQEGLVVVEPIPLQSHALHELFREGALVQHLHNDAYSSFTATGSGQFQLQLTHPATSKHIDRFIKQKHYRVRETPDLYREVVRPYIDGIPADRIQWVRNIVQGRSEQDRIIYHDPDPVFGFVLLPDIKWDATNVENLYIQAIATDATLRSIRDLRDRQLPLLRNILTTGIRAVADRYQIEPNLLRCYVHYHPSFYQFHVHIVHSALTTASCFVGRATLLEDIVDHIQLRGDYYQEMTLNYYLPESHDLYHLLNESAISTGTT